MKVISEYQKELALLHKKRCDICNGTGFVIDKELTDVFSYYRENTCTGCNGTGYKKLKRYVKPVIGRRR